MAMFPILFIIFQCSFGFLVAIAQALVENYTRAAKKLETRSLFTCILFITFPHGSVSLLCFATWLPERCKQFQGLYYGFAAEETCSVSVLGELGGHMSKSHFLRLSQNCHGLLQIATGKSLLSGLRPVSLLSTLAVIPCVQLMLF